MTNEFDNKGKRVLPYSGQRVVEIVDQAIQDDTIGFGIEPELPQDVLEKIRKNGFIGGKREYGESPCKPGKK